MRAMFDDIVERYDLLNGLLSLGLDRVWRRAAARAAGVAAGARVLDLGCGTGEMGETVADRARVTGVDVSPRMLAVARGRLDGRVCLVQGSAFRLPFRDDAFDGAVSGFVLRNLDDLPAAFGELARVLRPGARAALVDITEPPQALVRRAFDAYFGTVAPALGGLFGKRDAYRYLVGSLGQLPPPMQVCTMLRRAGFRTATARSLTGGMVTLFVAAREPS